VVCGVPCAMLDRWLAWMRERAPWLLLGLAAIVLVVHSLAYNFVTDDAYISFVYSRNFAEHGELTFNLGDPVEGYTNFLWTVVLGALMVVGVPPEISSRILGTACALGTLVLVLRVMQHALGRKTPWAAVPSLLLASSSGFACWTSGGLETQLFTLLVTAALEAVVAATKHPRALRRAGWLLALAAMTRPEGPLIAVMLGAAWIVHLVLAWRRPKSLPFSDHAEPPPPASILKHELVAAAWFIGLWAPWFAWRWWYYGHPFPNTYYVKASGKWTDPAFAKQMVDHGFYYVWVWLKQTGLLYALPLALLGLVAIRPRTPRFVLGLACAFVAVFYVPYTISVGGDFMGLHRFIMPLYVVAAIAVVLGFERFATALATPSIPTWIGVGILVVGYGLYVLAFTGLRHSTAMTTIAVIVVAVAFWSVGASRRAVGVLAVIGLAMFASTQRELTRKSLDPKNLLADRGVIDTPAFLIVYTEDRAQIGRAMAPCFRDDDFSIVGGAGAQPYFGRMRGIDVFGLVSDRIAHEAPRSRPRAGHTKWGSEQLLAEYDPTFVFSCYKIHRSAAQPQLPCFGFWRTKGFEQVTMKIEGLREQGEYYTFLAKKARNFQCHGRVR